MSQVFISYRQTDDVQRQRVRDFAERLQSCDIDVLLDQFVLGGKPEALAREALRLSERIGRQALIACDCHRLAEALICQDKKAEGLPYAHRSVEICTRLGLPDLAEAREILAECES